MSGKNKHLPRPVMIYDGDCFFCRRWIERWKNRTGASVAYAPYQEVARKYPQIPLKDFKASVQLVMTGGNVLKGAEAVLTALSFAPGRKWFLNLYKFFPGFKFAAEGFYWLVAGNRVFFSFLTRLLWGNDVNPPKYHIANWLFLRMMGLIYLIAFTSLAVQIKGLLGTNGLLPATRFLAAVQGQLGGSGYWLLPTLGWLNVGDFMLQALCWAGAVCSFFVILDIFPVLFLLANWILYLSLFNIGQDFLSFQWDILLLETGFLSIFLAPLYVFRKDARKITVPDSKWARALLLWLLFRLMFSSGAVKLLSGDALWHQLTALTVHYETQPLPHWISWYAHQLPLWFQKFSCAVMFYIELFVPFLIFFPRRLRLFAFLNMMFLQLLIFFTGNYNFFNLLAMALCFLLLDDKQWFSGIRNFMTEKDRYKFPRPTPLPVWPRWVIVPVSVLIFTLSSMQLSGTLKLKVAWPPGLFFLHNFFSPLQLTHGYGLFAVMTKERPEIIIEGSEDGVDWKPYEFKWKPGDLKRAPGFIEPHQPRLDWQMWFAALGHTCRYNPWFLNLIKRLSEGEPDVLALLSQNPFPKHPPVYLRALLYRYQFTGWDEKRTTGQWWSRTLVGDFCPVFTREGKALKQVP